MDCSPIALPAPWMRPAVHVFLTTDTTASINHAPASFLQSGVNQFGACIGFVTVAHRPVFFSEFDPAKALLSGGQLPVLGSCGGR